MSQREPTHRHVGGSEHYYTEWVDDQPVRHRIEPGEECSPRERDLEAFPDMFEPLVDQPTSQAAPRDDHTVLHARVDEGVREDLWDAGFETFEDVRDATVEELADVPGIGVVTAQEILEQVGVEVETEEDEEPEEDEE